MTVALELSIRVLGAALLGAVIGYERELRGKGAGIRTHVLVAMGSAMFMLISQYGFGQADKFDAARIAAGVVGGLGFLGGGIIMKTKNHVSGLTTAAGLWVTGSVGLGIGAGMYELGVLCTIVAIICLEALSLYSIRFGFRDLTAHFSAKSQDALTGALVSLGRQARDYSLSKEGDGYQAEVQMQVRKREYNADLLARLSTLPGVELVGLD